MITKRKHRFEQQNAAFQESEARYRSIFEASPLSIMAIRNGCLVSVNPAGCRMLGFFSPEEMIGMPAIKVVAPESREMIAKLIKRLESGKSNPLSEVVLIRKNGEKITIESSSVAIPIEGKTTVMVFAHDISLRKKMETKLRDSEARLNAFMNHYPAYIYIKDQNLRHVYANKNLLDSFGEKLQNFIGTTTHDFFPSNVARSIEKYDQAVLYERTGKAQEIKRKSKDGDYRWYNDLKFPIQIDAEKTLIGGISTDITERKCAEEKVEELRRFEQLLSDISTSFIDFPIEDLDKYINDALEQIGRLLGFDRCSFGHVTPDHKEMIVTHVWSPGSVSGVQQSYALKQYPWLLSPFMTGRSLFWDKSMGLPNGSEDDIRLLEESGMQSFAGIPVTVSGELKACLGFSNISDQKIWEPELYSRLNHLSRVFGNVLSRIHKDNELREQLAFVDLVSKLSETFIHIKASEIDSVIDNGLGLIATFLNVQRCSLFEFSKDNKELNLTNTFTVEGVEPALEKIYTHQQPWFANRLLIGKTCYFASLDELPREARAEKAHLKRTGVKSAISMPLMAAGASYGCITFSNLKTERQWPDNLVQQLTILAEVFSNALLRRRTHNIIQRRLDVESLLTNLATGFINLADKDVENYLEDALQKICDQFDADRVSILQFYSGMTELRRTHLWKRDSMDTEPYGLGLKIHQQFPGIYKRLRNAETIVIPGTASMQDADEEVVAYCQTIGIQSFIILPLIIGEINLGALILSATRSKISFPTEKVKQLRLFSTMVANALARQRTAHDLEVSEQNARQLAGRLLTIQENERKRLARELHDDLSQRLAVLSMSASQVRSNIEPLSAESAATIQNMHQQLVKISEDVHAISRQLHPSILEDLGLVDAVRNEVNAFHRRERIDIDYLSSDIPENLSKDVALCFFRIIQEGLRNIAKHSAADKASIDLSATKDSIHMEIVDQGCGIDQESSGEHGGLGLISMGERVRMIDGQFEITSSPGKGTCIRVSAPLYIKAS